MSQYMHPHSKDLGVKRPPPGCLSVIFLMALLVLKRINTSHLNGSDRSVKFRAVTLSWRMLSVEPNNSANPVRATAQLYLHETDIK